MIEQKHNLFVIGGANGAGKTSSALEILPNFLDCFEYVNADYIASALSPFRPDNVAFSAGKLMLKRIKELAIKQLDFAFESTLASKSFVNFINECRKIYKYKIHLIYFFIENPELAILRIKERVQSGGHDIPSDIVYRRYQRSLKNLFELYLPIVDTWRIYDNSGISPILVVEGLNEENYEVYNSISWKKILIQKEHVQ